MKQAIVFRSDLKLGKGKIAAHAGHAAIEGYELAKRKDPRLVSQWFSEGQKKVVLKVDSESELMAVYNDVSSRIPSELIRDAGLTQVEPGTVICLVIGPWHDEDIDRYTKSLKLL